MSNVLSKDKAVAVIERILFMRLRGRPLPSVKPGSHLWDRCGQDAMAHGTPWKGSAWETHYLSLQGLSKAPLEKGSQCLSHESKVAAL